jgi:gamma-glutamyltranspeptidase/glutathione hydrolase
MTLLHSGRCAVLALAACALCARAQPAPEIATGRAEKPSVAASRFLVVAAHPLAADAGYTVLKLGGSALDAAIAVQMMLGLVEPQSSGIGGGAFLLHWSAAQAKLRSYDGRETAPAAARPQRFLDARGQPLDLRETMASGLAVGVPGVLRMLEAAHARHGRLPWSELFQYAILAASEGFALTPRLHRLLARDPVLARDPSARALWYGSDGRPKPVGERIVNPEYAATLHAIARGGADAFYRGPIAADIVRAVRGHVRAGDLALEDLAAYRALEREPPCAPYRGERVCSIGPPGGGVAVLQRLGILERSAFARAPRASPEAAHLFSEAARLAYADRARYAADPDFVPQPVAGLLDPRYLAARAQLIGERAMGHASPGRPAGAPAAAAVAETGSAGTSHVSIVDAEGNAVAMTSSIEHAFGSRILVRGFLLNNQLTDFAFQPEAEGRPAANRVEPGKRPRSAMAPTMVFDRGGALKLVLGSPGGAPIPLYVARTLGAVLDWGYDIQTAVAAPNFGSVNGPTLLERGTGAEDWGDALAERGHILNFAPLPSGIHAIERIPGAWRSGTDPRREGAARGD